MEIRNPNGHFAVYHEVKRQLRQKAPKTLACDKDATRCSTGVLEMHYCCSAHKILNPTIEAPLSREEFHDTLKHYKISASQEQIREAHERYLSQACLMDVVDELEATGRAAYDLSEAGYDAEDAGDKELAMSFAHKAYEKTLEKMEIASKAVDKAKKMATAL